MLWKEENQVGSMPRREEAQRIGQDFGPPVAMGRAPQRAHPDQFLNRQFLFLREADDTFKLIPVL